MEIHFALTLQEKKKFLIVKLFKCSLLLYLNLASFPCLFFFFPFFSKKIAEPKRWTKSWFDFTNENKVTAFVACSLVLGTFYYYNKNNS